MLERLQGVEARWAVTGSTARALHGEDVTPRDLDLLTTAAGADEIAARVGVRAAPYERPGLRARRAVFEHVEVLGDVQNQLPGGRWTQPAAIEPEWIDGVPVLSREALEDIPRWTLRPLARPDFEWAYSLHKAALGACVDATWGWDEDDQRRRFTEGFDAWARDVIEVDGDPTGVVVVEDRPGELYLELIELVPEAQGRRLGTSLLRALIRYAHGTGRALGLHVLKANPRARALYEHEGLRVVEHDDVKVRMRTDVRG